MPSTPESIQTAKPKKPIVSVIIATAASDSRRFCIRNALDSALNQAGCEIELIVVANGHQCAHHVIKEIQNDHRVRFFHQPDMNVNSARLFGREQVSGEYFCFIDDDDDFIPDSLQHLVSELQNEQTLDIAVGNGYRNKGGFDEINIENISARNNDLLGSLVAFGGNWLPSCAGVFRTRTVKSEIFAEYPTYCEWTYFAFKLTITHKVKLFDVLTFRINDSSVSLSKGMEYNLGEYDSLKKIMSLPLPGDIVSAIKDKMSEQEHTLSEDYLRIGRLNESLKYHLLSMTRWHGLKYVPYTRKIIQFAFARR